MPWPRAMCCFQFAESEKPTALREEKQTYRLITAAQKPEAARGGRARAPGTREGEAGGGEHWAPTMAHVRGHSVGRKLISELLEISQSGLYFDREPLGKAGAVSQWVLLGKDSAAERSVP